MRWVILREFAEDYFPGQRRPKIDTLRREIEDGNIPGRRFGRDYYVDVDALERTYAHPADAEEFDTEVSALVGGVLSEAASG